MNADRKSEGTGTAPPRILAHTKIVELYVCPLCGSQLGYGQDDAEVDVWVCSQCGEEFAVSDRIPRLIPHEAYRRLPVQQSQDLYNKAYQHPELMGTKFDPEYSMVTKTILLDLVCEAPNPRILDIGTGDGDLWEFAPPDTSWYAVDLSEVGIRRAVQRFPSLKAAVAISEWLPYPSGYFGAVIAVDTIEHTFDLGQSLESIKRVLTAGGMFALSVPAPNSLRKWGYNHIFRGTPSLGLLAGLIKTVLLRTVLLGGPCFQPIDRDLHLGDWHRILEEAGFHVVTVREWPTKPFKPIVYLVSARVEL